MVDPDTELTRTSDSLSCRLLQVLLTQARLAAD